MSKEEEDRKLEKLVNLTIGDSREEKQERKEQLRKEPYSIVPVEFPQPILFEPVFLLDKVVIQLNVNHPFYQKVLAPLCGDLLKEESQEIYNEKSKLKDAIMLLLLSYAKAVAGFPEENIPLFDNLLVSWGTVLATVVNTME